MRCAHSMISRRAAAPWARNRHGFRHERLQTAAGGSRKQATGLLRFLGEREPASQLAFARSSRGSRPAVRNAGACRAVEHA